MESQRYTENIIADSPCKFFCNRIGCNGPPPVEVDWVSSSLFVRVNETPVFCELCVIGFTTVQYSTLPESRACQNMV